MTVVHTKHISLKQDLLSILKNVCLFIDHKKNEAEFVYSSSVNPGPLIEKCSQQEAEAEEEAVPESVVDAADLAHDTTCNLHCYHDLKAEVVISGGKNAISTIATRFE